jgi:hypothetical protein
MVRESAVRGARTAGSRSGKCTRTFEPHAATYRLVAVWSPLSSMSFDQRRLTREQFIQTQQDAVLITMSIEGTLTGGSRGLYAPMKAGRSIPPRWEASDWLVHPIRKGTQSVFNTHISLGRTMTTDICIPHASVSKFHAYFINEPGSLCHRLGDGASKNGTFVSGDRLRPREPVLLSDETLIRFGDIQARYLSPAGLFDFLNAGALTGQSAAPAR